jgi:hypothetical protein
MAWSGGIWIIYNVNPLPLTNECQQRGSTDYVIGVAHNTSRILAWVNATLSPQLVGSASSDHSTSVIIAALTLALQMAGFGRPMCLLLGLIRAVGGQKLHHQFLPAISLSPSLMTPVS